MLARLFRQQDGICAICGMPMLLLKKGSPTSQNKYAATIDHIIPKSMGGKLSGNSRAVHGYCNWTRNDNEQRPRFIDTMVLRLSNKNFLKVLGIG